jgi:hypothetical protein
MTVLWAQLVELEQNGNANQLDKAHVVRQICEGEQLSVREFAKKASTQHGLSGLSAHSSVSRLLAWAQLVDIAHERGVVPAGTTPAARTLRPLFSKRVPVPERIELLAKAVVDGDVTVKRVRAVVREAYPPDPSVRVQARGRKRPTIKPLRKLIAEFGFDAVDAGWMHLVAEQQRREAKEGDRAD